MAHRNLDPNPSAANNLTGRSSAGTGTMTQVTGLSSPWLRATASQATMTAAFGQLLGAVHNPAVDLAGQPFSAVIQFMFSAAPAADAGPFLMAYDSAGTYIGNIASAAPTITPGTPQTGVLTGTAPAGTQRVGVALFGGSTLTAGLVMTLGLVRIDQILDPNLLPRDGSDPGWAFDGTAGNSASTSLFNGAPALIRGPSPAPGNRHEFRDDFTGAADGALDGRLAPTGQVWDTFAAGSSGSQAMTIGGGAIGPPPGHNPGGGTANGQTAGYAGPETPLTDNVDQMGALFRFDSGSSGTALSSLCLLAHSGTAPDPTAAAECPIHVAVGPATVGVAVWTGGVANFIYVRANSNPGSDLTTLPAPLARDGTTVHRVDVWLDRRGGLLYVNVSGNPTLVYANALFTTASGIHPLWEYFGVRDASNVPGNELGRFVTVWADRRR